MHGNPDPRHPLVVTAAHCVLDASGSIDPALKVLRKGDEYRVVSVLVDTRYHTSPSPLLDAAVLVTDTVIPGPAVTLGASFPTAGLVTLAGFEPLDTDGTLLPRYSIRRPPPGRWRTGGIVHISSAAAGRTQPASAAQVTATRATMPCGLVPGASGGGLFVEVATRCSLSASSQPCRTTSPPTCWRCSRPYTACSTTHSCTPTTYPTKPPSPPRPRLPIVR